MRFSPPVRVDGPKMDGGPEPEVGDRDHWHRLVWNRLGHRAFGSEGGCLASG
ncbi:hypothetical protein B0H12DRAFT_666154 [Mycena haematopus]|nr:hypothetical protein B0H12DRAFT_666154 [Mycena haematopus]